MMALVGVLRPRLLVTRGLVAALTDEELAASIAHEVGHSRARDNLKRLLMRAAPDLLTATPAARAIERRWASAAEHRADRMAADDSPVARCALASALVKVARLTPAMTPLASRSARSWTAATSRRASNVCWRRPRRPHGAGRPSRWTVLPSGPPLLRRSCTRRRSDSSMAPPNRWSIASRASLTWALGTVARLNLVACASEALRRTF